MNTKNPDGPVGMKSTKPGMSRRIKIIPSYAYNPEPKAPSRADRKREIGKFMKIEHSKR